MKKIVHISDLHFGTEDEGVLNSLIVDITNTSPNLIAVSGDLTQRARTKEYLKARSFLEHLKFPQVIIPGNHDIPLYNLLGRITNPFNKFNTYFDKELREYNDDQLYVIGLNSVRNLRWKSGKLSSEQIEIGTTEFGESDKNIVRILVIHHNLFHISSRRNTVKLFKSKLLRRWLMENRIDLVLFGHDHKSMIEPVLFDDDKFIDFILLQAGTATSKRTRGVPNSYNIIIFDNSFMNVMVRTFNADRFETTLEAKFIKNPIGWEKQSENHDQY